MIWLDNRPLDALVYALLGLEGWRDAAPYERGVSWYPNTTGAELGTTITLTPREVTITCDIRPDQLRERVPQLDAIYAACEGVKALRFADAVDREVLAEFRGATFRDYGGGAFAHPGGYLDLKWRFVSLWRAVESVVVAPITTTPVRVSLGTASSPYVLSVMGSATDPIVTLRAASGAVLDTLTLTGSVGSTERLEISSDGTLTLVTASGTRTPAQTWRTSGDVPVLDPRNAPSRFDGALSLTVSSGTGVLVHTPQYRS